MMRSLFMTIIFLIYAAIAMMVMKFGLWLILGGSPMGGMFINGVGGWMLIHGACTYRIAMLLEQLYE